MTAGPLDETWAAWTARIAADIAALTEDDWLTLAVRVPSRASSTYAAGRAPRGWRRGRARSAAPARVPDVFCQVRRDFRGEERFTLRGGSNCPEELFAWRVL